MKEWITRLTWVDYLVIAGVLRGFYVGYKGGFFPEILRVASYLAMALISFNFYEWLGQWLTLKTFLNSASAGLLGFVSLLLASFILTKLIQMLILKILKVGEGGFIGRVSGLLLGGCRWLVLLSLLFMGVDRSPLTQLKKDIHQRSVVGDKVSKAGPVIFDFLSNLSPQLGLRSGA